MFENSHYLTFKGPKVIRFNDSEPQGKITRTPQEGGGMPEYKKVWLEKYEPIVSDWAPYDSRRKKGDKGVFLIEEYEVRMERNNFYDPSKPEDSKNPKEKEMLAITFGLYSPDGSEKLLSGTSKKPQAIEYRFPNPKPTLSWSNFQKTSFYDFIGRLGYEILETDLEMDYDVLVGLFAVFEIKVIPSKKNADLKFGNVVKETIQLPLDIDFADKQIEHNETQLLKMFGH